MGFTMNFSGHSEYPTCTLLGALMVHFSYLGRTERGPMGTEIACKRKAITSRDYVFLGYTGRGGQTRSDKPISDTGVYLLFKHYCQVVGAGTHAPPTCARATAITKLLADGIPHRQVQEFSRHASIQMVEWYDKRRFSVDENVGVGLEYEG